MNQQRAFARAAVPLRLRSQLNLHDLANLVSKELLGGAVFEPLTDHDKHIIELYQNVPALRVYLLGLVLVLQGYGGSDGYILDVFAIVDVPDPLYARRDSYMATHIGGLLLNLEEKIGGFEVVAP
jgi:hypothetical protein